jgi:hypothetical protein
MTRLLLTLLALLTGLAAQTAPAQARLGSASEVAAQLAQSAERNVEARQAAAALPAGGNARIVLAPPPLPLLAPLAPAVHTGIDRARE